jgi:hypothetical protein
MNFELKIRFPIWASWLRKFSVPDLQREGIPRGDRLPIGGKKFEAAAATLLYPKGLRTTAAVAAAVEVNSGVYRNWKGEERFQDLVRNLEYDFSDHALKSMAEPSLLQELYESDDTEPILWSDGVLRIFIYNLAIFLQTEFFSDLVEETEFQKRLMEGLGISEEEKNKLRIYGDFLPGQREKAVFTPKHPMLADIAREILQAAVHSYQRYDAAYEDQKRDKRDKGNRNKLEETIEAYMSGNIGLSISGLLNNLEQAIEAKDEKRIQYFLVLCKGYAQVICKKLARKRSEALYKTGAYTIKIVLPIPKEEV